MLIEASVGNFQSFVTPQTIRFEPTVTFLVGRNDVGKSALLRALRVFAEPQVAGRMGFSLTLIQAIEAERLLTRVNLPPQGVPSFPMQQRLREVLSSFDQVVIRQDYVSTAASAA